MSDNKQLDTEGIFSENATGKHKALQWSMLLVAATGLVLALKYEASTAPALPVPQASVITQDSTNADCQQRITTETRTADGKGGVIVETRVSNASCLHNSEGNSLLWHAAKLAVLSIL